MSNDIDISVVIGFRNWGQRRLQLAVKSILDSFGELEGEVIVSDYGSDDGQVTQSGIEDVGARYIYTKTDGTWSRSRALNAGFAHAKGKILVSTDADMIFSPKSFEIIGRTLLEDPSLCLLLQCRDLPPEWGDREVSEAGFNWDVFSAVSRLRPRWGMGGMMAVHRDVYTRIRGLDERMHTYGGEDIDFATRAKRAGQRLLWVEDPHVRMYHMWHQPTRALVEVAQEAREAIEYNKNIVYKDATFVRNTSAWAFPLQDAPPLVSVAIATHNRAEYLKQSINSVLGQTMQDFEIIIVDDGSTDGTKSIVESFGDSRIRYFRQEQSGVAAARNYAADMSRGMYTAVHDDDDLMTPWRLQAQLDVIHAGLHGSFGAFVNFDNSTGAMHLYRGKALNPGTIDETGGAPGHGTWLVETEILRRLRYDESLSSGVDNNLALRMVRSGFKFVHCGEILMLRRLHNGQITVTDEHSQKLAARQTRQVFSFGITDWGSKKMKEERGAADWTEIRNADNLASLIPFLPDHLVDRSLDLPQFVLKDLGPHHIRFVENNELIGSLLPSRKITAAELALLTPTGGSLGVVASLKSEISSLGTSHLVTPEETLRRYLISLSHKALSNDVPDNSACIIFEDSDNASIDSEKDELNFVETVSIDLHGTRKSYSLYLDPGQVAWGKYISSANFVVYSITTLGKLNFPEESTLTGSIEGKA